jgi:hypothetical protein
MPRNASREIRHCDKADRSLPSRLSDWVPPSSANLLETCPASLVADPGLLRVIACAHDIHACLMQGTDLTLHAIASQERVSPGYISRLLRLPLLAPDIISAIVNGKNPPRLTAKKLMRLALQIPIDWTEQRKLLGFHNG